MSDQTAQPNTEETLTEEPISVTDLASQLGKRKQTVFKVLKRLGIQPRMLRNSGRRGQLVSYVTAQESRLVAVELRSGRRVSRLGDDVAVSPEALPDEHGVFYLLLLEPEHDPGRFKVGFAVSLPERLRTLRCSAPFTKVVRTWPCKMLWEKTAIDCVTEGCKQLHTEVFRTESIEPVVRRCEEFFKLMPNLHDRDD
ncbi:MAG: hypothetical protein ABI759_19640 [Candidatus Solibacter sp.]